MGLGAGPGDFSRDSCFDSVCDIEIASDEVRVSGSETSKHIESPDGRELSVERKTKKSRGSPPKDVLIVDLA